MTTLPKRERLVDAARTMFYRQGVNRTTLADIAQEAQVPLGNIYYHFRTKDALVEAVIEAHRRDLLAMFAQWEHLPDPRERLVALLAVSREQEQALARFGCPHGSLCLELDKEDTEIVGVAAHMLQLYIDWARAQFLQLGRNDHEAQDLAIDFISALQGTLLLTASFRSPELLERKLQRLEAWARSL